jgi:hypothetical protein
LQERTTRRVNIGGRRGISGKRCEDWREGSRKASVW